MAEQNSAPRAAGNRKPLLIAAGLVVVLAVAAGAYFLFAGPQATPGGTVAAVPGSATDAALVGGGQVGDLQAFLERSVPAEARSRLSYTVAGNKLLNLATTSTDGTTKITAREVEFKALDTAHEQPYFADVRIRGMTVTPPPGTLPEGQTSLDMDMVYAYEYDPAAKTLSIPSVAVDLKDLAKLNLSARFSSLDAAPSASIETLLGGAKIDSLNLVIDNETLLKVLLEAAAKQKGTDLATLTAAGLQGAQQLEQSAGDPLTKQLAVAAQVLMQKVVNVTITVIAAPPQPYPLAGLVGAFLTGSGSLPNLAALKDLNVSITAQ